MSTKGHIPLRMCIGCRKRRKKKEMVRFKQGKEGILFMDEKQEAPRTGTLSLPGGDVFKVGPEKNSDESGL